MQKNYKIIVILCLIASVARFVLDSYLPSLPGISRAFTISANNAELTLTLYLFGFALSQLIYGPLSDYYGRKTIILTGLSVFFLGNLTCALAHTAHALFLARFIAGAGAGSCGVLNRAIASDCYKGAEFSKVWSYTTTALVITLCVAPVLGGYIQELSGWRANFAVSTILIGTVITVILRYLPETNLQKHNMAALNIHRIFANYKIILQTPGFFVSTLCYMFAFAGLIIYFQVSPQLLINVVGLTPAQFGWCSLAIAANYFLGGLFVSKLAPRIGIQPLLVLGAIMLIVGGSSMWIAAFDDQKELLNTLLPAAMYVIGARIVIPNAIASSMEKLRHLNGSCSALIGFIQMLGSSLISFAISKCDNSTSLPLAIFLTGIGCITFCLAVYFIRHKLAPILTLIEESYKYLTQRT